MLSGGLVLALWIGAVHAGPVPAAGSTDLYGEAMLAISEGRLDDAIQECQKAIEVDPEFGNAYNDLGAYLIEQGKHDEAIPWLERALGAGRYESYHFPWFNLGRAYAAMDCYGRALECFRESLSIAPDYAPAVDAMRSARLKIH